MPSADLLAILEHLRSTRFRDLAGAQVTMHLPLSERLLNEFVAATMPRNLPVREVSVRPEAGDRFSVRLTPKTSLLPPLTLRLDIERQPELPVSPVIVLRMATMSGLLGLASAAFPIGSLLPPGVRLEGDRILVDLLALASQQGVGDLLALARQVRVTSEPGRVILHIDAAVS